MSKLELPKDIDSRHIFIICPDGRCNGFTEPVLRCTRLEIGCPYKNRAKLVTVCPNGHLVEESVIVSRWTHTKCQCGSVNFNKMNGVTQRVLLTKYSKFKKLKIR